jgi:hypothetical protein
LDLAKSLLVVLVSSAREIMQVVNQAEDLPVHPHKLDQGHVLVLELNKVETIEDLFEGAHDNHDLLVGQTVLRLLILMLKVLALLEKQVWEGN